MKYYLRNFILLIALAPFFPAFAQELNEKVTVKGEYDIDIVKTDRIYTLPQRISFAPPKFHLDYQLKGEIVDYDTWYTPLVALGFKDKMQFDRRRGYLDVASGSFLNTSASAGYRFIDNPDFSLSAMLQHTSTSLFHPHLSTEADKIKRYIYDETLGVRADRNFSNFGTLSAEAYYRLAFFNYYGILTPTYGKDSDKAPTQTLNDATFRISLLSRPSFESRNPLEYHAEAGVRYFGYRALYNFDGRNLSQLKGSRETDVNISGGISRPLSDVAAIGLDARLDLLFYGGDSEKAKNYGSVEGTPYFRLSNGKLALKAGVNLAYTFDFDNELDAYSKFHVAPDVRFDWKYRAFGLYAVFGGGVKLQTLSYLSQYDFYRRPEAGKTQPIVTPIDSRIGFTFGPWGGFSTGISAGYASTKNILLGGWYMVGLAYGITPSPISSIMSPAEDSYINLHGFTFGADINYAPTDWISASASGSWQRQKGSTGIFNGYDRPEWTVAGKLDVSPLAHNHNKIAGSWKLSAKYEYRGNRAIYSPVITHDYFNNASESHKLKNVSDLSIATSIDLSRNFTLYAKGLNLLGCRAVPLPMQPVEGAGFLIGFDWKF